MEIKYIKIGDLVREVYFIDEDAGVYVFTNSIHTHHEKIYDDSFDAWYDNLLIKLRDGRPLSDYECTSFYDRYLERLKKDNPELLI